MKIDELKSELQEKEKEVEQFRNLGIYGDDENLNEEEYCLILNTEISTLKKGISACEEALSNRNQEILEIIEKLEWDFVPRYNNPKNIGNVGYFAGRFGNFEVETNLTKELFKELKKQLTTTSEGKE